MSGLRANEQGELDELADEAAACEAASGQRQYCPECGYDLHAAPANVANELICCAECGGQWRVNDLLQSPPPGPIGQVALAVAAWAGRSLKIGLFITLLLLLIGSLLAPALSKSRCGCGMSRTVSYLRQISIAMTAYAAEHNDRYPQHAAQLLIGGYAGSDLFTNPKKSRPVSFVGPFQLESHDGSPRSDAALRAAIELSNLNAPYYRVGDFWIARFDRPMNDARLISGWSYIDSKGKRSVMFEDGHSRQATLADWPGLWQSDAAARQSLKLPPLAAPAW